VKERKRERKKEEREREIQKEREREWKRERDREIERERKLEGIEKERERVIERNRERKRKRKEREPPVWLHLHFRTKARARKTAAARSVRSGGDKISQQQEKLQLLQYSEEGGGAFIPWLAAHYYSPIHKIPLIPPSQPTSFTGLPYGYRKILILTHFRLEKVDLKENMFLAHKSYCMVTSHAKYHTYT
jgi:hypothetical protein